MSSATSNSPNTSITGTSAPPMPAISHTVHIKLTQENYLLWKTQLLPYLTSQGLVGYIDGSYPRPSQTILIPSNEETGESRRLAVNPEYTSWYHQDQLVLSAILASVSEEVLGNLVGINTAIDAWRTLERTFSASSRARIMQIRMQLATTKKGDMTVAAYYRKMKGFADTLAAIGKKLDDEELIAYILQGLGSEYDSVVTSITTGLGAYTLSDVYAHMMSYELRLEQHNAEIQANAASRNSGGSGGRFGRGRGRGGSPGGGRSPGGRGNRQNQSGSSNSRNGTPCQICLKTNHDASRCWHRFDQNYQPEEVTKAAATATTNGYTVDPDWYVDTGATDHITSDLERLTTRERYNGGDQVQVANGSGSSHEDNSAKRRM